MPDALAWTGLSEQPILQVGVTVLAFLFAVRLARWRGNNPFLNPTLDDTRFLLSRLQAMVREHERAGSRCLDQRCRLQSSGVLRDRPVEGQDVRCRGPDAAMVERPA